MRARLLQGALSLLGLLPVGLARRLGRATGLLAHCLLRRQRALSHRHLRLAFPKEDKAFVRRTARASFAGLGENLFELCAVGSSDEAVGGLVRASKEDLAPLDEALAEGRGCIVVTGHIGNWELAARALSERGYDCAAVARRFHDPGLGDPIEKLRSKGGVKTLARGAPGTVRDLLRQLRNGGIIFMLVDQDTNVPSVFAPFFGKEAKTPRGPAELALRAKVALVTGFIHRDKKSKVHSMRAERLGAPCATGDRETDVLALTAAINGRIEEEIRAHPEDWVWFHERWRSTPEKTPDAAAVTAGS